MKKFFLSVLFIFLYSIAFSQKDTVDNNGYSSFHYPNGNISSCGNLKDGKPDGYWKTFYENGFIKSEGNRKDYQLDSLWKFYSDQGKLILEINYKNDKKNGIKRTYLEKETLEEKYLNDSKEGLTNLFYENGKIKQTTNFVDGRENGLSKEYDQDGTVITLVEYKKGFVLYRENINRKDKNNLKQNWWKTFYDKGNVKSEGFYRDGKKDGYFKEYDPDGNLTSILKYTGDSLQVDVKELTKLDVKTEYYSSGVVKTIQSFKGNTAEGLRREYSSKGKLERSFIFSNGRKVGEGIVDEQGVRQGKWKEFYETGEIKNEGEYKDGKKIGPWKYYHRNGKTEQIGQYNKKGLPTGLWKWFYESGNILREENMENGLEEGMMTEYADTTGAIITKGDFIEGYEEGFWFYELGDYKEEGNFKNGKKDSIWKTYYPDKSLLFEGKYTDDNPDGRHTYYYDNGKIKETGNYIMGKKDGEWKKNNYDGTPFLVTLYKNGIEIRFDGVLVKPTTEPTEDQ
ncbi:MAG: toxin-antitoxin system YwqK family antitoxin [Bacteroidetes bacterium]|nr:toxin-antitoxin system YwqK family antitoxin [Bacteroidota bacterium]